MDICPRCTSVDTCTGHDICVGFLRGLCCARSPIRVQQQQQAQQPQPSEQLLGGPECKVTVTEGMNVFHFSRMITVASICKPAWEQRIIVQSPTGKEYDVKGVYRRDGQVVITTKDFPV